MAILTNLNIKNMFDLFYTFIISYIIPSVFKLLVKSRGANSHENVSIDI